MVIFPSNKKHNNVKFTSHTKSLEHTNLIFYGKINVSLIFEIAILVMSLH